MLTPKTRDANAKESLIPIVYSSEYKFGFDDTLSVLNILDDNYPLDLSKFSKIAEQLSRKFRFPHSKLQKLNDEDSALFHSCEYVTSIRLNKSVINGIIGIEIPQAITASVVNRYLIDPIRYAASGTVEAARLALKHGWAINIGGGYHHAKKEAGGGFCFFNDYAIATIKLRERQPKLKILYIDLDAHIGDGVFLFAKEINNFYIFDVYNTFTNLAAHKRVFKESDDGRFVLVGLESYTGDELYLSLLKEYLPDVISKVKPDFIFYNGGGDILKGDKLGCLSVSPDGMMQRDLFVFGEAKKRSIPIAMCLSGGYGNENYKSVANSLEAVVCLMMG